MYYARLHPMVLLVVAVVSTQLPVAAQSSNGGRPSDATTQFTLTGVCTFPVTVSVQGSVKMLQFGDRSTVIAPAQKATITNNNTGKDLTLNITGSFHITQLPNGNSVYDVTGRNLLWGGTLPTLTLAIGNFSFTLDSSFQEVSPLQGYGTRTDVCAGLL